MNSHCASGCGADAIYGPCMVASASARSKIRYMGRLYKRAKDLILIGGSLDAIDASSDEVDHPTHAVKFPSPLAQRAGVPANVPPRSADWRRIARQQDHRLAQRSQVQGERNAK